MTTCQRRLRSGVFKLTAELHQPRLEGFGLVTQKMLQEGQRPAAALRNAQIEMWNHKRWRAPYNWAAFTLQGEWR
jgi:hypothetical protein